MKIVIIGGVAAGMSAAAKAKRIMPGAEVVVYEKTDVVSFGACGLPYFVGDFFQDPNEMVARTAEKFRETGIDVRDKHEVVSIQPESKTLRVKTLQRTKSLKIHMIV